MFFVAKGLFLPYSAYKLRPLANVVRGKPVVYALGWLGVYKSKRSRPLRKVIESAVANARSGKNIEPQQLMIKEICIDQGPTHRYFRPGAMGRSVIQRKRLCHISVKLEAVDHSAPEQKRSQRGTEG